MKKIISSLSTSISLNSINNDSHIIGIYGKYNNVSHGDIHIVARIGLAKYTLISIRDNEVWDWDWDDKFSLIRDLIAHYQEEFDFYLLDDWKEIKEF